MTLEQLRIFVAVAEEQHVTNAARRLNHTQSATSAAIAAFEQRHDVRLFDRVGRHIELTEAGRKFLPEARNVLARARDAEAVLQDLAKARRGVLRISSSQTVASYWLPRFLVALRKAHPAIDIELSVNSTAMTAEAVAGGLADIGFVEAPIADTSLESVAVAADKMHVVVNAAHPWAQVVDLSIEDLTSSDWVLREKGAGTRIVFEQHLVEEGIRLDDLRIVLELPTNEAVRAAVEAGMGATVLSASIVASSIDEGLLHVAPVALPDRLFSVVTHRQRALSATACAFIDLLGVPALARSASQPKPQAGRLAEPPH